MSNSPAATPAVGGAARGVARFYWCWLVFATSVSVLGNITHALLVAPSGFRLLAAVASVVPPAFVLGSTHSVALSLRTRRFAMAYVMGLLMTIGIAACAFFLSFDALRALAVILGWPPDRAWLFPVAIDVSIAQATFGLLSLTPETTHSAHPPPTCVEDEPAVVPPPPKPRARQQLPCNGATVGAGRLAEEPCAVPAHPADETIDVATSVNDAATVPANKTETRRWRHTAHQLVRNGTTSKDPEIVAAILAEHAAGTPPSTISRRRGVHHSTVGRILAGAADLAR
ncbi:hypothetical protein GGC64_006205 [Mycobacterium sp. OAS707]|uniref:DUF2637 domain-containing protein n=1 Tax=Mycobacterium sp. OAS707 TaxID=2663822 RepID=UPI001789BD8B|nr:DUF2637 domain-containing protein [Mycobacterium sp. OAS707]MBE1552118.1 hypothetical protein [Mycobacterium sp. OAS707]